MGEPWNLPQGRTRPLRIEEEDQLVRAGGSETPCYGCGSPKPPHLGAAYMCDRCGRVLCDHCWADARHIRFGCCLPSATVEAQAAEWAKEIRAGRVTPGGVIATGVVADMEGEA